MTSAAKAGGKGDGFGTAEAVPCQTPQNAELWYKTVHEWLAHYLK